MTTQNTGTIVIGTEVIESVAVDQTFKTGGSSTAVIESPAGEMPVTADESVSHESITVAQETQLSSEVTPEDVGTTQLLDSSDKNHPIEFMGVPVHSVALFIDEAFVARLGSVNRVVILSLPNGAAGLFFKVDTNKEHPLAQGHPVGVSRIHGAIRDRLEGTQTVSTVRAVRPTNRVERNMQQGRRDEADNSSRVPNYDCFGQTSFNVRAVGCIRPMDIPQLKIDWDKVHPVELENGAEVRGLRGHKIVDKEGQVRFIGREQGLCRLIKIVRLAKANSWREVTDQQMNADRQGWKPQDRRVGGNCGVKTLQPYTEPQDELKKYVDKMWELIYRTSNLGVYEAFGAVIADLAKVTSVDLFEGQKNIIWGRFHDRIRAERGKEEYLGKSGAKILVKKDLADLNLDHAFPETNSYNRIIENMMVIRSDNPDASEEALNLLESLVSFQDIMGGYETAEEAAKDVDARNLVEPIIKGCQRFQYKDEDGILDEVLAVKAAMERYGRARKNERQGQSRGWISQRNSQEVREARGPKTQFNGNRRPDGKGRRNDDSRQGRYAEA